MKKILFITLLITFGYISCSNFSNIKDIFKERIPIEKAIKKKQLMDKSRNPAYKYLITKKLKEKIIEINDVIVKDITVSGNIDYDFCVIVEVPHQKGNIECFIYSKNLDIISKLQRNTSKIDITGHFDRFFTLLDDTYTKIEIINATILIKGVK